MTRFSPRRYPWPVLGTSRLRPQYGLARLRMSLVQQYHIFSTEVYSGDLYVWNKEIITSSKRRMIAAG